MYFVYLDMDRLWSLIEDWLLGFLGGLLGGDDELLQVGDLMVFDSAAPPALDIVEYKDFIESRKLDFGCVPVDPAALYSDPGVLEVSLKIENHRVSSTQNTPIHSTIHRMVNFVSIFPWGISCFSKGLHNFQLCTF